MTTEPIPTPAGPAGLLLSRDLIFTSKVTSTARALGQRVIVAGNAALASALIEQWHPKVVFVDLSAGELVSPAALSTYQKLAGPQTPFVAFGSHVDTASLAAAAAAGCDPVLPRSRFSAELPTLVRRYLGGPSGEGAAPAS
ncbi:MAG: response regulator [Isosphaeraceae bacterium]|nr:response regulator [Isosphaeraceae bacterium]